MLIEKSYNCIKIPSICSEWQKSSTNTQLLHICQCLIDTVCSLLCTAETRQPVELNASPSAKHNIINSESQIRLKLKSCFRRPDDISRDASFRRVPKLEGVSWSATSAWRSASSQITASSLCVYTTRRTELSSFLERQRRASSQESSQT